MPKGKTYQPDIKPVWGTTSDGRCRGCNIPLQGSMKAYEVIVKELQISHRMVGCCPVCGRMAVLFKEVRGE